MIKKSGSYATYGKENYYKNGNERDRESFYDDYHLIQYCCFSQNAFLM